MSAVPVQSAKQALRRAINRRLKAVPPAEVTQDSAAVVAHVLASPWYKRARNISCYLSTPTGEVNTDGIILDALNSGKSLFVPFCPIDEPTVMRMLRLRSVAHFEGLKLNRWGIRELDPEEVELLEDGEARSSRATPRTLLTLLTVEHESAGGLDLILVPGLAFDKQKRRLGHGRGYYDRYIEATQDYATRFNKPSPFTAALALRAQIVGEDEVLPTNELDKLPDVLVTPDEEIH
ncbi:hypothetical protein BCR35DRAFT_291354 [Leucosporidium creatinivorum]|uniref:5-formyltetrahydrofolate cyclo-ligase n=1 Tax=Leucosporidium creatinivorum TaxID=106004 RepID=A0A1Y2F8Q5_9BASI|nr:hypothetical protein BCR35DRAFT_291354 [Leucosporidium creatinivorum]